MVMQALLSISFALSVADPRYPPCTATRTDICTDSKPTWPTLYIPCPPHTYCPPYDIPHPGKQQRESERFRGEPDE